MKDYSHLSQEDKAELNSLGHLLAILPKTSPSYLEIKKRYDKLIKKGK